MIVRIWHGWTTAAKADPYERLLREEIFPGIAAKGGQFADEDYERAYVPPKAREVLARFDDRSVHYELRERFET